MSIEAARNSAYAHLGEAWLRYQSARILQRHLQYGQHCRLDLETLLAAAAGTIASRNLNNRASNERFRQGTIDAIDFCSSLETCDQRQVVGAPGFDLDQRAYVLAADAQQLTSTARDEVSRDRG